jgi:hypothetical protein
LRVTPPISYVVESVTGRLLACAKICFAHTKNNIVKNIFNAYTSDLNTSLFS